MQYTFFRTLLILVSCGMHGAASVLGRRLDLIQVRDGVVEPKLCEKVPQHSGYLDLKTDARLFFWFFGARYGGTDRPLILWLNGAPGNSALMGSNAGMFPCNIDGSPNPTAWNVNANLLILDQFIDSGYSYSTGEPRPSSNDTRTIYMFLQKFLRKYPEYRMSPLHVFGDSFAGHQVVSLARLILDMNKGAGAHMDLQSVGLGNSLLDPLEQMEAQPDILCHLHRGKLCADLRQGVQECRPKFKRCYETKDDQACSDASRCHWDLTVDPVLKSGRDIHNLRQPFNTNPRAAASAKAARYFNQESVANELGAEAIFMDHIQLDSFPEFIFSPHNALPSTELLSNLLRAKIRVILYTGDQDYIFSHVAIDSISRKLDWPGAQRFSNTPLSPLKEITSSKVVGEFRKSDLLSFVKIFNSGGKPQFDQPQVMQAIVDAWVNPINNYN